MAAKTAGGTRDRSKVMESSGLERFQLRQQQIVDDLGVRPTVRELHHLSDEEALYLVIA